VTANTTRFHHATIILFSLLIVLAVQIPTDIYMPSFPAIIKHFKISNSLMQYTVTLYMFLYGISHFIYGPLLDRYGRRRVIILASFLFALGTLVCGFANSIGLFFLGRIIQGLCAGAFSTTSRALLRDCFSHHKLAHASSTLSMVFAVVPPMAPILGGYLQVNFGWRSVFFFLSSYVFLVCVLLLFFLPETLSEKEKTIHLKKIIMDYKKIIFHSIFLRYALCSSLALAGIIVYVIESPFYFQQKLGLSPVTYGFLFLATALSLSFGAFLNRRLVKKTISLERLIFSGSFIMILTSIGMFSALALGYSTVWSVLLFMMFYMVGAGLIFANSFSLALSHLEKGIGMGASAYGALQMICVGILTSLIVQFTGNAQLIIAGTITTISIFIFALSMTQ